MSSYIALLRGINVSGKNKIHMTDLQQLFQNLGYKKVVTYLQSGNVVFSTPRKLDTGKAARTIEQSIQKTFGHDVPVLILTAGDMDQIFLQNPNLPKAQKTLAPFYVTFLFDKASKRNTEALKRPEKETASYLLKEYVVYIQCPDGYGKTKINNQFFEKKLGVPATTRNWKTVTAVRDLAVNASR